MRTVAHCPSLPPTLTLTHETVSIAGGGGYEDVRAALATFGVGAMEQESRHRFILESLGLTEIDYISDCSLPPSCLADYLIGFDEDPQTICSFVRYAVPQLRQLGWEVSIADDFPWQLVEDDTPWYQDWDRKDNDWFALELGVIVDGQRVNLVPALLDLVKDARDLDSLCRKSRRIVAVEVGESKYLPVPVTQMRSILEPLIEIYNDERDSFIIDRSRLPAIIETLSTHESGPVTRPQATNAPPKKVEAPSGLQATLRPYQETGLAWLQNLRKIGGGILADDMGLGKTLQTIAHLLLEVESGRARTPCLIVAPTSLLHNWKREFGKFAPALDVYIHHGKDRARKAETLAARDIVITTYGLAHRNLELLSQIHWHFVVLDEAHYIKNSGGAMHRAITSIECHHRLALTGTPIENNLGELWSIFNFANPDLLGNREQFRSSFQTPIENGDSQWKLEALRQRIEPYILRRLKEDVATELPGKTEIVRAVELDSAQRNLYESIRLAAHRDVRSAIAAKGFGRSTIAILDALLKLRQVCCDPRLVRLPSARKVKRSAKMDALLELIVTQLEQGRRILVFSQFTNMLELIGKELRMRAITYLQLTGASRHRQRLVDQFNKRVADVFLLSLKAAGVGLNLVSADTVIHVDPWWNPTTQAQATDRAYRIGQKKPVTVYKLIVAGGVEERMLQIQERKNQLANAMLHGEITSDSRLTEDDVNELFGAMDA